MFDESKIGPNSTPFVKVTFDYGKEKITIPHINIKEATIEGATPLSRTGDIKCIDPLNILPDYLTRLGAYTNSFMGAMNPNISVEFGWRGIIGQGLVVRSVTGLITKTAFDITAEGITTVDIHFIETAVEVLQRIKFMNANDIQYIFKCEKLKNMSAGGKLSWLFDVNQSPNLSIHEILKRSNIKLWNVASRTDDKPDGIPLEINFGDSLIDVINSLCAKAEHTKVEGKNYSYERLKVYTVYDPKVGKDISHIYYGWRGSPDIEAGFEDKFDDLPLEGKLKWKSSTSNKWENGQIKESWKQILTWTSDLNTKTHIIHQAQDALTEKLRDFEQKDIDEINKGIRDRGMEEITRTESGMIFTDGRDAERRNKLRTTMTDIIKAEFGMEDKSKNNQMAAILNNNVFKATATIMGDPTIGTDYGAYERKFITDFSNVGGLGNVFGDRFWTFTKSRHIFTEGSYTTEMELLSYPPPPGKKIDDEYQWREQIEMTKKRQL